MGSLWVVVPAALLYAVLIAPQLTTALPSLMNPTLTAIANLLGQPKGATVAWVHFLAFDLFVGRWAYLDSRNTNITAWLVSPALFAILMVGPLGLLVYLLVRQFSKSAT